METDLILNDKHEYFFKGYKIDGLTATLKESGLIRNSDPWYADRGQKIHLATELWDKNKLDEESLDIQIIPYLESWKRFRKDQSYTPTHIEYQTYHPELMVGTKIDRLPLLDLKSGSPEPWHVLQIGFQRECLKIHKMNENFRMNPMSVYLNPDGGPPKIKVYKVVEMMEAFKVYASMLYFIRWKRQKGIKNGNSG